MKIRDLEWALWNELPPIARVTYNTVMEEVELRYPDGECPVDDICDDIMLAALEVLDASA